MPGWALKNWWFWTVVLEKTLERPLDCKEIKPLNPEGNQAWIFIGKTDAEAETPILWPPNAKNWLIGKDPEAGKDWGKEENGVTEDELVDGSSDSMVVSLSKLRGMVKDTEAWSAAIHGARESDMTEWLNDNDNLPHNLHFLEHRGCSMYAHCPHFVISHIQILLLRWNLLFFSRKITRQGALQKDGFY